MIKTDKLDGGYVLTADVGKDLVVIDGEADVAKKTALQSQYDAAEQPQS